MDDLSLYVFFWLHWVFNAACELSLVAARGLSSCSAQPLGHAGFSSCDARALECRFSSCGARA